jgi:hypothetical protein
MPKLIMINISMRFVLLTPSLHDSF